MKFKEIYYFYSAISFSFGIAIIINSMKEGNLLRILGILGASIFIGIGLLPFPMRNIKT